MAAVNADKHPSTGSDPATQTNNSQSQKSKDFFEPGIHGVMACKSNSSFWVTILLNNEHHDTAR